MVTMEVDCNQGLQVGTPASLPKGMDELQYSRLIYTLGREAFEALHQSRVLILGCKGLGAEVAKNLVLSGIGGIGLVDDAKVTIADLGSHCLLTEADVGQNRAISTGKNLRELNSSVVVDVITPSSLKVSISNFHLLIATSGTLPELVQLDNLCRSIGIPFIAAESRGLFSFVFVDLGDLFWVKDETGESSGPVLIASVTQDFPATVTVVEEQRHSLEDGDEVMFTGIKGMKELNRSEPYRISVTGTHSFTIQEDTRMFSRYTGGGYFSKVKSLKPVHFLPLEAALRHPKFFASGAPDSSNELQVHIAFQAIDEHLRLHNVGSGGDALHLKEDDMKKILASAREIWQSTMLANSNTGCGNGSFATQEASDIAVRERISRIEVDLVNTGESENAGEQGSMGNEVWEDGVIRSLHSEPDLGGSPVNNGRNHLVKNKHVHVIGAKQDDVSGKAVADIVGRIDGLDEKLVRVLAQGSCAEICPLVSVTGGVAAQEVIKAVSKVFMPLRQWLYFDASDCAPGHLVSPAERAPLDSRYDQQIAIFGKEFQQKLGSLQWLVVGAGGIGCEVLKNLVLMGAGCSPNGSITITDMDCVSKPNLTDQLLYRIDDVGRQKTPTAGRALRRMNSAAQIHALQEKFDIETETIFDSTFFQSIGGVFSAVDTASSRLYIDMRCVSYRRPMIDGGKHGTKGSVQVFVPFQSEMYASTRDPPEFKESPICTLRNFPYSTEHTLRWAVEMFESLFKQRPEDVNAYLSNRDFQDSIRKANPSTRLPILETLRDALSKHRPLSFEACVQWARLQFEDLFVNSIKQLCFNFPEGMTTTSGVPFWSGTKRIPVPLAFDATDALHMDFIVATANLQATVYGLKGCQDRARFMDILQKVGVPHFEPKEGVKIAVSDNELRSSGQQKGPTILEDSNAADACEAIIRELPTPASLAGYRLSPIEFQKDDEQNFHADFVVAAANLRARNYGIPPSDKLQARLVGGRAIPSIITTTAVVGGLMCLELYKTLQEKPLDKFKHSYFNLALPFFSAAEPIKAVVNKVDRIQHPPLLWTLWDKFEMDCVGMSLETFLAEFKRQHGLEITMISYGKSLLYAEFVAKKKLQERMPLTLLELITAVGKVTVPSTENKVMLSISCTDTYDNDVEVPDVIAQVR